MSDFVFARKSRNAASSAVHALLNILLGLGTVLITIFTGSPILGIILVTISKWRVFAVRSRYLWLNIKSNLVDFIVGISVVMLVYYNGTSILPVHIVLALFYTIWLLFIKPLSSESAALAQSLIAVFLGICASTLFSADKDAILAVILAFAIGFATSRHVLAQATSRDFTLTTLIGGLIFAEIAWLCYSWNIVYHISIPFETGIRVPQVAIILTIFAFVYSCARNAMIKYQEDFRFRHILAPVSFGVILVSILLIWFSNPMFNI